jgi:hypothetical protein
MDFFFSVADPDPGSGAFLTPGSGIRDKHPGSATPDFLKFVKIMKSLHRLKVVSKHFL